MNTEPKKIEAGSYLIGGRIAWVRQSGDRNHVIVHFDDGSYTSAYTDTFVTWQAQKCVDKRSL